MKIPSLSLCLVPICAWATTVSAHEYPVCKEITNNSCWSIRNDSKEPVSLHCQNESGARFQVEKLKSEGTWSYQFCSGLADGLGFAAGNVTCKAERPGKPAATFQFNAKDFGDRVQFEVRDGKIKVRFLPVGTKKASYESETKL